MPPTKNILTKEQIDTFLSEEREKIDRADILQKQLDAFMFLKHFRPKYFRLLKKYREIIKSFRIG